MTKRSDEEIAKAYWLRWSTANRCSRGYNSMDVALVRAGRLAGEAKVRAYLISCPYCGLDVQGKPISFQISHVTACADKRIAEWRKANG